MAEHRLHVEDIAEDARFVRLSAIDGVAIDLRYAGPHNFAGRVLYDGFDCAWLRREAAQGLAEAARCLAAERPGHRILVLDALRPQRVQQSIWQGVVGTPMQRYFADPEVGSIHSFGLAVDVTLIDAAGRELDMGSGFDEMSERSHPSLHDEHLARGTLTREHVAARDTLARALAAGGFAGIDTEWWHFDHGDRQHVRRHGQRVW